MSKGIMKLVIVFACLAATYYSTSAYFVSKGIAHSPSDIRRVYTNTDPIYQTLLEESHLWKFPFPDEVKWRSIRRGSTIGLVGTVTLESAKQFLHELQHEALSADTMPVETGFFALTDGPVTTRGVIDLETGTFRIDSYPTTARD